MRALLTALLLLAVWSPGTVAQQPRAIDAVVIDGPAVETPAVTPLEVAQSLDAVRQEIAAAKETYGEDSAQVRLLTEILHNLEGTFRQQLTDRGMIRTAGHQESAEHKEHEADDGAEEEEHEARGGQHRGHNDEAIAQLTRQFGELRAEVEILKHHVNDRRQVPQLHRTPNGLFKPHDPSAHRTYSNAERDAERREQVRERLRPSQLDRSVLQERNGLELHQARQRIAQLERENAALRQQRGVGGGAPAGPRAERVLNALRDQTLQHQAEATKRIEQSFDQMQRRLQELEQSQSTERPRADRPREQRRGEVQRRTEEQRRPEERRRDARPPRTSSAQPL